MCAVYIIHTQFELLSVYKYTKVHCFHLYCLQVLTATKGSFLYPYKRFCRMLYDFCNIINWSWIPFILPKIPRVGGRNFYNCKYFTYVQQNSVYFYPWLRWGKIEITIKLLPLLSVDLLRNWRKLFHTWCFSYASFLFIKSYTNSDWIMVV